MKFTDMVLATEASTRARQEGDVDRDSAGQDQARSRLAELSVLLAEQADAIRALPADLLMEPDLVVLDVDRDGRRLQLEVFFETEVWKLYFVSWIVTTASGADEGHGKAATAEETLALMADMIGRHFAGARPTIARA